MKTLQPMSKDKFRSLLEEERDKRAQKGVDENGEPLKIWTDEDIDRLVRLAEKKNLVYDEPQTDENIYPSHRNRSYLSLCQNSSRDREERFYPDNLQDTTPLFPWDPANASRKSDRTRWNQFSFPNFQQPGWDNGNRGLSPLHILLRRAYNSSRSCYSYKYNRMREEAIRYDRQNN